MSIDFNALVSNLAGHETEMCRGLFEAIRPQYLSLHQISSTQGKCYRSQTHIPTRYQILPTPKISYRLCKVQPNIE